MIKKLSALALTLIPVAAFADVAAPASTERFSIWMTSGTGLAIAIFLIALSITLAAVKKVKTYIPVIMITTFALLFVIAKLLIVMGPHK